MSTCNFLEMIRLKIVVDQWKNLCVYNVCPIQLKIIFFVLIINLSLAYWKRRSTHLIDGRLIEINCMRVCVRVSTYTNKRTCVCAALFLSVTSNIASFDFYIPTNHILSRCGPQYTFSWPIQANFEFEYYIELYYT